MDRSFDELARNKLAHSARVLLDPEMKKARSLLETGERVLTLAHVHHEEAGGLLTVTDRRVLFIGRKLVLEDRSFRRVLTEYRCEQIKAVESEIGHLAGRVTLTASRAKPVFGDIAPKERAQEIERAIHDQLVCLRRSSAHARKTNRVADSKASSAVRGRR